MFDSVYVDFKCPVCGSEKDRFEIQTKEGECNLENWGVGSVSTLKPGTLMESFWPECCSEREVTDQEQIEAAVQDKMAGQIHRGGKLYEYRNDRWTFHARLTVSRKRVIEKIEMLKPCSDCHGNGYKNYLEVHGTKWGMGKPHPDHVDCAACDNLGYLEEVVAGVS